MFFFFFLQSFCDEEYGGDYTVEPQKVVRFLTEKVFTRTRILTINLESGYNGIIGLLAHDPVENPELAKQEEQKIKLKFSTGIEKQAR
jgi:hypothetical protein